ncbi:MAG: hypothetical protein OEW37_05995 [Rhodospirillaceae bacterium]|nr:hypothetical protein [Rhodospirillaceae bacterium]
MKTITLDQLTPLLKQAWTHEQTIDFSDSGTKTIEHYDRKSETSELEHIAWTQGFAWVTSKLDGITITYTESFGYDDYDEDSFNASTDGMDEVWKIEGLTVLDDGDEMSESEIADYLDESFSTIDYSGLDFDETIDIDVDEDSEMETYTVEIDNQPNVKFTGKKIGGASTSNNQASSYYSGTVGRWTVLRLYQTAKGKYICEQINYTQHQGEHNRFSGAVCETLDEVFKFFGYRWLAKELYDDAGIECTVTVE